MDLFLKIIGGLALTAFLLIGGFLFFLWWKLRGIAKGLAASTTPPSTVDLTLEADPKWIKKENVRRDFAALEADGYVRGAAYTVDGMPGVSLVALHHPVTGVYGCYYDHTVAGNWADLCANFCDGLELTVSNAPQGSEMDTRPDTEKVFLPGRPVSEIHQRLAERLTARALKPVAPENFKAEFVAAYARDMAWRNAKDGTSEEEFRRVAANHGKDLTDEQLKEAFKETKLQELRNWSEEALAGFAKSTTLSVAEWKQYEDQMIILRESFHAHAYLDYLTDTVTLEDETVEKYRQALDGGISLAGLLKRIAADTGHEFIKIGEVSTPRQVEIYGVKLAPEKDA
jgi:hypothetical protein